MDKQARKMVVEAREMALFLAPSACGAPGSPAFEKEVARLQISHLFPNLDARAQFLLLSLKYARRVVLLAFHASKNLLDIEAFVRGAEEQFLRAKKRVWESGILSQLNPLQREIVESDFLEMDLDWGAGRPCLDLDWFCEPGGLSPASRSA